VLGGTPVGVHVTRHARRLARRLASHDAGRTPPGAPPWRFWAPGAALLSPLPPSACASAGSGSVTASSSQPGRSAWRAGSRASRGDGYEPPPQDATPRSAFRMPREHALNEQGCEQSSIASIRSQEGSWHVVTRRCPARLEVPERKGKFAIKNFFLDSRYTNLPEERIHRNYVWIAAFGGQRT
jgi:hypothetical protein